MNALQQYMHTHTPELIVTVVTCLALPAGLTECAHADEIQKYTAYKQTLLQPTQEDYARILAKYASDSKMKQFQDRLNLIDQVSAVLIKRLEATRSQSMREAFGDIIGTATTTPAARVKPPAMDARDIYTEHVGRFAADLPAPPVTEQELAVLRKRYDLSLRCAEEFILKYGQSAAAIDNTTETSVLELYLVMAFLHVPDQQWGQASIEALPDWVRKAGPLKVFEEFALRLRRPATAMEFARYGHANQWNEQTICAYLMEKARQFSKGLAQYDVSISCYRQAIAVAERGRQQELALKVRLELAELLSVMQHPELSAAEMKEAMKADGQASEWPRAAMLRLKYLYDAKDHDAILQEAPVLQADKRSEPSLPQIMYISWVTHRVKNKQDAADKLMKEFLEKYPKNPLCADMYFAQAMGMMAEGNYVEVLRLFEIIEYRYPSAKVLPKVKAIREQLKKATTASAPAQ